MVVSGQRESAHPDPEDLGLLAFGHRLEEFGVMFGEGAAPEGVVVEGFEVGVFCWWFRLSSD